MRVCILGNSHLASLKQGWDRLQAEAGRDGVGGVSVHFFGSRQWGLKALDLVGAELHPCNAILERDLTFTSGGMRRIDLTSYDAFFLYGLMFPIPELRRGWSAAVKRQACKDTLSRSLAAELARKIRSAVDRPIYMGHNPRPARQSEQRVAEDTMDYSSVCEFMQPEVKAQGADLVCQPLETLETNRWFTQSHFSLGSVRLDVGDGISSEAHPQSEVEHMNGDFGLLYLKQLLLGMQNPVES